MNQTWYPHFTEFAESLTTALLHFVWQGAVLALLLHRMVKLFKVKSAGTRYLLSLGTLVLMAAAPLVTILWNHCEARPISSAELSDRLPVGTQIPEIADANEQPQSAVLNRPDVKTIILVAWLTGVLILSTRLTLGFGITLWIRTNVTPVSPSIEQLARTLGERMRVRAANRVYASLRVGQALAVGIIRPIVLIPTVWLTQLTPEMLEAVIAHELAHLRRWDLWVNLLQRIIEVLLFYHPAVWWLSRRMRLEREMCCDEMAASCLDRAAYARSLESVARMSRGNLLLATSIQGGRQMNLLNRIRYVLGTVPAETSGNWWAAGFVAMLFPFLTFAITTGSTPQSAIAEDEKPAKADDVDLKIGDRVGMKISGKLMTEFLHLVCPDKEFEPGGEEFFIGTVAWKFADGTCRIEYSNGIDRGDNTPQMMTVAAIVPCSKIQMTPPLKKENRVMEDGKVVEIEFVPINGVVKETGKKTEKSDKKIEKSPPDKTNVKLAPPSKKWKREYYYVELSDPEGVTMRIWELKRQADE